MIVITTPTGTIGARVTDSLAASGAPLRLIARDPSRLPASLREHVEVVEGSHSDPAVLDVALADADALFVLVPPNFRAPDVAGHYLGFARPIAEAVRRHGVSRVVAVSSLGRGYTGPAGLLSAAWAMDDVLESGGAAYRSLQPPFFMENLLHQTDLIRDRDMFSLTGDPDEPMALVATADIADIASGLLLDSSWTGQNGVVVRAPTDLTPRQMATTMSAALGRTISYLQTDLDDYRNQYASLGASPAIVDGMVEMAEAQAAGVYPPAPGDGTGTEFSTWCTDVLLGVVGR